MGYSTNFSGNVTFSSKTPLHLLKYITENKISRLYEDYLDYLDTSTYIDSNSFTFYGDWKAYDENIEKLMYFFLAIDEKVTGEVECKGEDDEDIWKVKIENGVVTRMDAVITYEESNDCIYPEIDDKLRELKTDKDLMTKILVGCVDG